MLSQPQTGGSGLQCAPTGRPSLRGEDTHVTVDSHRPSNWFSKQYLHLSFWLPANFPWALPRPHWARSPLRHGYRGLPVPGGTFQFEDYPTAPVPVTRVRFARE